MEFVARVDSKYRLQIPVLYRDILNIERGQKLLVHVEHVKAGTAGGVEWSDEEDE